MKVTWEEAGRDGPGWEELSPCAGRYRLPVWDCTAGLVVGEDAALMVDAGASVREGAWLRARARRVLGGGLLSVPGRAPGDGQEPRSERRSGGRQGSGGGRKSGGRQGSEGGRKSGDGRAPEGGRAPGDGSGSGSGHRPGDGPGAGDGSGPRGGHKPGSGSGSGSRVGGRWWGGVGLVTHLALTHPHFDHVCGAAAFAGVEVFGAVGVERVLDRGREELRADAVRNGADPDEAAEAADLLVRPRHLVAGERTLDLGGGTRVRLANLGPGHSGHDLAVLVTTAGAPDVVFSGDLVEESGEPQAGPDAVPARWPAALDRLLSLGGEDALYVPGHGAVVDAAFVRSQRDALARRFGVP